MSSASSSDAKYVAQFFSRISNELKSNSENWKPRQAALAELEKFVSEELASAGPDAEELLSAHLLSLSPALITQISDLRSELVKQAAHTISFLAENMPNGFSKTAVKLVPTLIHVASGTNGVIRGHSDPAIKSLVTYCQNPLILVDLASEFKSTKSKTLKQLCMELIQIVLKEWPTKSLKKNVKELEETIFQGLSSAESATRQSAAYCTLFLNDHFPSRFKGFIQSLDSRAQKIVLEAENKGFEGAVRASPEDADGAASGSASSAAIAPVRKSSGRRDSINSRLSSSSTSSLPLLPDGETGEDDLAQVSPSSSASGSVILLDQGEITYGSRVEVIEPIESPDPLDPAIDADGDNGNYRNYVGNKGTVVTIGELEASSGEWVGIQLDMEDPEQQDSAPIVYIRRRCLTAVQQVKQPKKSPPADGPGSKLKHLMKRKSITAGVGDAKGLGLSSTAPARVPSAAVGTSPAKVRSPRAAAPVRPATAVRPTATSPGSSSLTSGIPKSSGISRSVTAAARPISSAASSASSIASAIPRGKVTRGSTPQRSRETSPERSAPPPLSRPISAPLQPPINPRATGPSSVNFHATVSATSPQKDSSSAAPSVSSPSLSSSSASSAPSSLVVEEWVDPDISSRDRMFSVPESRDLPLLVKDHRIHVAESALHLQQLNALLNSHATNPHYVEHMIKLLSEHLSKTTKLLDGYMKLKRRTVNAAKIREEHDDFLDKMDNFR